MKDEQGRIHYNVLSLKGYGVTDQEMASMHGIDPALANTKELNEAILRKVYEENIKLAMRGRRKLSEEEATSEASKRRSAAKRDIEALYKQHGY